MSDIRLNLTFEITGGTSPYRLIVGIKEHIFFTEGRKSIYTEPGNYTLILTDANNCKVEKSVIVGN